jgi:hypothetical protein
MSAHGAAFAALFLAFGGPDEDLASSLAKLKAVAPEGKGNEEAARAWREVVSRGPEALLPALAAFDGADLRAANWLRSAVDALVEGAVAKKQPLDLQSLEAFIVDAKGPAVGRALAYEWLARLDPAAPDRILPGLLDDPGRELRRHAVARELAAAEMLLKGPDKKAAVLPLRKLLPSARERDQVDVIVKHLKTLGVDTDVQALYGVLAKWVLITSFDNTGMKGFDIAYAPEKAVDLKAGIPGKGEKAVRYVSHTTAEPRGKIDLNSVLGKEMGAVAYAYAVVESPAEQPVELRVASNNAVKLFLNGQLLFFRNEYHHGMAMDQYVGHGMLRKGPNEVLLKICQNEQKDDWAQSWGFQARLSDALGGAVPFANVTPEVKP